MNVIIMKKHTHYKNGTNPSGASIGDDEMTEEVADSANKTAEEDNSGDNNPQQDDNYTLGAMLESRRYGLV